MPPTSAKPLPFQIDDEHTVDIDASYYAVDKATLLHLPGGAAIAKATTDSVRCFVYPKASSLKVTAAYSTWLSKETATAIIFPKMVEFIDEREKCVAVFWRTVDRDGEPWVVCLRPPFDPDHLHTDSDLCAVKLNQVKSFHPIKNESGGSMLTYVNKFIKDGSVVLKHQKLGSAAAVISFAAKDNPKMFLASKMQALSELELRIRRAQKTARAGQKDPAARAAQEDQQAELAKCRDELKYLEELKSYLELRLPVLELPLLTRLLHVTSLDTWQSDLAALCVAYRPIIPF